MSHFTKLRTKMMDETCLRKALARQGYTVPAGPAVIAGWNGQSKTVDVGIPDIGNGYGIGFERERQGMFTAVADWSELNYRGFKRGPFVDSISQAYGIEATLATMQPQGFVVAEQKSETDGSVRIVMRRVS